MRNIGTLPTESDAKTLSGVLYAHGIETDIEPEDDGTFSIWVHDDDQVAEAAAMLARYRMTPTAAEFRTTAALADKERARAERAERKRRSTVVDEARLGHERTEFHGGVVAVVLLLLCLAATVWTDFGKNKATFRLLAFSERGYVHEPLPPEITEATRARYGVSDTLIPEVRAGQVWRLFTPIFVHMDYAHIIFNMMVFFQLAQFFESRFGPWRLAVFILCAAASSNFAEYWWSTPNFGGMSGVNYALFGFLWMKGRFGRDQTWRMAPQMVQWMLIWLVLCYTGALGPIANAAHTVGLLVGVVWGYSSACVWPWIVQRMGGR